MKTKLTNPKDKFSAAMTRSQVQMNFNIKQIGGWFRIRPVMNMDRSGLGHIHLVQVQPRFSSNLSKAPIKRKVR